MLAANHLRAMNEALGEMEQAQQAAALAANPPPKPSGMRSAFGGQPRLPRPVTPGGLKPLPEDPLERCRTLNPKL